MAGDGEAEWIDLVSRAYWVWTGVVSGWWLLIIGGEPWLVAGGCG